MGRPNAANLAKYVAALRAGGVNKPLDVIEATLKENCQFGGVVSKWVAPEGTPVLTSPFPPRPVSYSFTLETAA